MRLVDADAFKAEGRELYREAGWDLREVHYSQLDMECNIDMMPTIEAEPFKTFAHWVASEVCNTGFEDMWSLGAFAEVACRKLYALGVVQKFRDEWVYLDKDELDGGENGTD